MNPFEQIGKIGRWFRRGKYETYVKRATNRARRREEKKDPENAPKKPQYRGYTT